VELLDDTQLRHIAHLFQFVEHNIAGSGDGAGGVLRVQREQQDALAVLFPEFVQCLRNGRFPITHGVVHDQRHVAGIFAQIALQQRGLSLGMHLERRAFIHPDAEIFFGGLLGAGIEYHAVEDGAPQDARHFHDARVVQEFLQVFSEGLFGRGLRRAEID
jgi:hypothetical protein